jgi:hypothetical protein
VPIPAKPIVADALSASIIGGIFGGAGIGIALRSGGSSGGMDIVGMFFTKKFKGFSVGRISLMLNAVVYGICAVLFGVQTAIYCIIYSAVSMLVTDRTHTQNINAEVIIFTKKEPVQIMDYIVKQFKRDATWWEAKGGYTEEKTYMTIVILSKYECAQLRRELKQIDNTCNIRTSRKKMQIPDKKCSDYLTDTKHSTIIQVSGHNKEIYAHRKNQHTHDRRNISFPKFHLFMSYNNSHSNPHLRTIICTHQICFKCVSNVCIHKSDVQFFTVLILLSAFFHLLIP